jgi:small-conductance mechanosensitive channel
MLAKLGKHDYLLRDPRSERPQQPPYCKNATRSIRPDYFVVIGICTHLGCSPTFREQVGAPDLGADWPGGYFCPCHGSKFDLAGRVFKGVTGSAQSGRSAASVRLCEPSAYRRSDVGDAACGIGSRIRSAASVPAFSACGRRCRLRRSFASDDLNLQNERMLVELQAFGADYPMLTGWLITVAIALAAILASLVGHRVAWAAASRLTRSRVFASAFLRFARDPARLVLALVALQFVWDAAPDDLPRLVTVEHFTTLALIGALAWLGIRSVAALADAVVQLNPVDGTENLHARRVRTQTQVLARTVMGLIVFIGVALGLMTFPAVRTLGTSLLASAGVAGLVIGIAARPVLGNLIAGLQLALAQPIRIDDVVVIEGEWGRIEEIHGNYVVVQIWDERRLMVPLQWFIEHPFQNWTLTSAQILGTVFVWADYRLPLAPLRAELERLCKGAPEWDHRVCVLQVTEAGERAMQLRALVSSADSSLNWDLRCRVREGLIHFMQEHYPGCLPQARVELEEPIAQQPPQ